MFPKALEQALKHEDFDQSSLADKGKKQPFHGSNSKKFIAALTGVWQSKLSESAKLDRLEQMLCPYEYEGENSVAQKVLSENLAEGLGDALRLIMARQKNPPAKRHEIAESIFR